jgi:hypothetical protein
MNTPRCHDGMRLVPTRSAITCAGLFVVSTLTSGELRLSSVVRCEKTEELVTAAVKATGVPEERMYWTELTRIEYLTVQLYGFESVRIEVWDSAPNLPLLPEETDSPIKRGYCPTPRGGARRYGLSYSPERETPGFARLIAVEPQRAGHGSPQRGHRRVDLIKVLGLSEDSYVGAWVLPARCSPRRLLP